MKCIECSKWSPKEAREMAQYGYGLCAHRQKWHFISAETSCEKFAPAPAPTVAARVRYLESRSPRPKSAESSLRPPEPWSNVSRETTDARTPSEIPKSSTGQLALS